MHIDDPCPYCGKREIQLLSTTGEYKYYCPHCDSRMCSLSFGRMAEIDCKRCGKRHHVSLQCEATGDA
jgi:hypothetical protein